jgi:hypothetical protein
MPATNRLRHVAQWQNCPVKPPDIVAARESAYGTKRTIAALQQFGRYWTNNGQREAPGLNGSAANDPYATSGKPSMWATLLFLQP